MSRAITQAQWHQVERMLSERNHSVKEITQITAVSRSSIYRRFPQARAHFGKVVTKRLNRDRLKQVENLLRARELTVAEISTRTGISITLSLIHI